MVKHFIRPLVGFALVLSTACAAWAENLNLISAPGGQVSAVLTTTDRAADPAHAGAFKGTGTIAFTFAGQTLPAIGPMPYSGLMVAGTQVNGGSFTTSKAETISNAFGVGLGLNLASGSNFTLTGPTPTTFKFTGTAGVTVPFKDPTGNAIKGSLTAFSLSSTGAMTATATLALSGPMKLPGVTITTGTFSLNMSVPAGGSPAISWTCPSASIAISLPGATTNDDQPITLTAQNVSFDADGLISIASAGLANGAPVTVSLAEPSNFTLTLTSAQVTMDHSSITSADFKGSLTLPPIFSSQDKASGSADPVTLKDVEVKVANDGVVVSSGTSPIDLYWNGFHLSIPSGGIVVDLSNTAGVAGEVDPDGKALPASWQGCYIKSASLEFPKGFGNGAKLAVNNFIIDSGGISGKLTASNLAGFAPPGFPGHLDSLSLTLLHAKVADFDAAGAIALGGDMGEVGVKVNCTEAGLFSLTLNQKSPVNFSSLGVQLQVDQGTFTSAPDGTQKFSITGSISVPSNSSGVMSFLKGTTFAVKDLNVDSTGKVSIGGAWLDLPHPEGVDLGPVSIELSQIGFSTDTNGKLQIGLTGDVAIKELPVSGQIGFDGLTISAGPNISFGGIHLNASVPDVVTIEAELDHTVFDGTTMAPAYPAWAGKKEDVYRGSASVSLDMFGPSGSFGGALQFMVANTGWYFIGSADIGEGIQLGPTPFSLFGFEGGFGHNVLPDKPGATGVPGQDYQLIPYAPGQSGDEWMLLAGVRIGTSDQFTAWGDVVLSLMFGDSLILDLNGKVEIMETASSYPMGSDLPEDRELTADIHYDGPSSTFHASAGANFYLPDKKTYDGGFGVKATGGLDLLISPGDKHFYMGGPINYTVGQQPVIQNPIAVGIMGIDTSQAAMDVDYNNGTLSVGVASILGFSFSESAGPFSASITDQQWFYGGLKVSPAGLQSADLALGIDASAEFSFNCWLFSLSIGAGVNGDLYGHLSNGSGGYNLQVGGDLNVWVEACGIGGNIGVHFQLGS